MTYFIYSTEKMALFSSSCKMLDVKEQRHTADLHELESLSLFDHTVKALGRMTRSSPIGLLTVCLGSLQLLIMAVVLTASIPYSAAAQFIYVKS